MKNTKLVYTTDARKNHKCDRCNNLIIECTCANEAEVYVSDFTAVLRIEKSGRKGKTVSVIDRLPKNDAYLKDLTKSLKTQCGSGGTYKSDGKNGIVEIQGDKLAIIRKILTQKSIKFKG